MILLQIKKLFSLFNTYIRETKYKNINQPKFHPTVTYD